MRKLATNHAPASPPPCSNLPKGWQSLALDQVAEIEMGQSPPGESYNVKGYGMPLVNGPVEFGPTAFSKTIRSKFTTQPTKLCQENDLILCVRGSTTGRMNIAGFDACIGRGVAAIRAKNAECQPYINWFIHSKQSDIFHRGTGSTFPNVSRSQIASIPVLSPPLPEQLRIVAEIEKQFTRLDAGVAALRRVQANLKHYRAAVLKAACEGQLVPTEEELQKAKGKGQDFETGEQLLQRTLAARRKNWNGRGRYIEPDAPEKTNRPALPAGWTTGTWDQISNWVTYGFTRPMPHVEAGIPIITARSVNKGKIIFEAAHLTTKDAFEKLSEKDKPQVGDILITKDGTIGRAAVVDTHREFCINQSVAVIWLRSCPMERKFLLTVIESELTQKPIWAKARGVAIQHLSITDFAKMALPIPPLAEQKRIVAEVERRLSVVEELETVVYANLQRATRLRQSILHKAFKGELAC